MLGKITPQPDFLGRAPVTAADRPDIAIGVQHHDGPVAQIVTVVAFAGRTSLCAPILEITDGPATAIFVIPERRFGAILELPPRHVIAVAELLRASLLVGQIPCSKRRPVNLPNQPGGSFGALRMLAGRNVARANQGKGATRLRGRGSLFGRFR